MIDSIPAATGPKATAVGEQRDHKMAASSSPTVEAGEEPQEGEKERI